MGLGGSGKALIRWCLPRRSEQQAAASREDQGKASWRTGHVRSPGRCKLACSGHQRSKWALLWGTDSPGPWLGRRQGSGAQGQTRWDLMLQIQSILLNLICSGKPLEDFKWGLGLHF